MCVFIMLLLWTNFENRPQLHHPLTLFYHTVIVSHNIDFDPTCFYCCFINCIILIASCLNLPFTFCVGKNVLSVF